MKRTGIQTGLHPCKRADRPKGRQTDRPTNAECTRTYGKDRELHGLDQKRTEKKGKGKQGKGKEKTKKKEKKGKGKERNAKKIQKRKQKKSIKEKKIKQIKAKK
jgi:hypothetical protein